MANIILEKKVHYLGSWQRSRVDNEVIQQINSEILNEKGQKVKLQLSGDGIRVVKSSMIQGKMLQEFLPLEKIQFLTVSKRMPDLLIVIALARDPKYRFQIQAYRCANGVDASIYMDVFRKFQRKVHSVTVVKTNKAVQEEEINWTLRNKEQDNSKRELKKLVDLHGEKAIVHKKESDDHVSVIPNGHTQVYETGVRIPLYRKGRPSRIDSTASESEERMENLDSRSEVSESALRIELESLSQELRDIKLMLEQSTGITAGSEPGSPREFKSMDVKVNSQTVSKPQTIVYRQVDSDDDVAIETEVVENEEVQMRPKRSGYQVTTNGNTAHVRVSVPDYRSKTDHSNPGVEYTVTKRESGYGGVTRPPTTTYDNWKRNTIERNAVVYRDIPERIQWKSHGNRHSHSHVVTSRPRSAIPSFTPGMDGSRMVEVRHHSAGLGPTYQRVSFNPRAGTLQDRKTQSLRYKGLSTTIARPIEKVYTGRPDAKHHSLVYRGPAANVRPSILVRDSSVHGSQTFQMEENNNVVKVDPSDEQLLDVSGIDLYKETPHDVTVTEGAIIRT